ncbi:MAG: hypothetical protein IJM21_02070 [Clostridia bacterium]|nr:hypothetical protein [Clostridia bacterium]
MTDYYLGIDLGTTSVSVSLLPADGSPAEALSVPHGAAIGGSAETEDPEKLLAAARSLFLAAEKKRPGRIVSIGVTGQMHGILYLDRNGKPLSPLYTWQNQVARSPLPSGKSALEEIRERTGRVLFAGYGLATHYALSRAGLVPREAASFATAGDFLAMTLAGKSRPLLHPTNAHSVGFFDRTENRFAGYEALPDCRAELFPAVAAEEAPFGDFRGVPVSLAVGDNQASFFGAMREEDGLLLNLGTGGQLSALTGRRELPEGLEARPYFAGRTLAACSSLAGGRAYAMLERFVRSLLGAEEPVYPLLNALAEKGVREKKILPVDARFAGTRLDPGRRGAITGIGEENFTPEALAAGFLYGMTRELGEALPLFGRSFSFLAATGNAVRRNPVLLRVIEDVFGLPAHLPRHTEEAGFGAALYGAVAAGLLNEKGARDLIRYENEGDMP